jgi:hypothetical protein
MNDVAQKHEAPLLRHLLAVLPFCLLTCTCVHVIQGRSVDPEEHGRTMEEWSCGGGRGNYLRLGPDALLFDLRHFFKRGRLQRLALCGNTRPGD